MAKHRWATHGHRYITCRAHQWYTTYGPLELYGLDWYEFSIGCRVGECCDHCCDGACKLPPPQKTDENGSKGVESKGNHGDSASLEADKEIDGAALKSLGSRVLNERVFAPPVCNQLAIRIADIFKIGMPEKEFIELIEKYPAPANCTVIEPPQLNSEFTMGKGNDEMGLRRDKRIESNQRKTTAALAIGQKGISMLIDQKSSFEKLKAQIPNDSAAYSELEKLITERSTLIELFGGA